MCRLNRETRDWVLCDFNTADLLKGKRVERQKVTCGGADEHVTIVVGSVIQLCDETAGLKGLYSGQILLDPIEEHEEGLQPLLSSFPDACTASLSMVATGKEQFPRQLLRSALLCIKLTILPIESWHANYVDLIDL